MDVLHFRCSYIFLVNFELFPTLLVVVIKTGQVRIWWVLIIDFIKSDLELKLLLIDSFQKTI